MISAAVWEVDAPNTFTFLMRDGAGSPASGLSPTVNLAKGTGAFSVGAGTVGELGGAGNGQGFYFYTSTVAEADTIGPITIYIEAAGAVRQNLEYVVGSRVIGAVQFTYTVTDDVPLLPIQGVRVLITTDVAGLNQIYRLYTDVAGVARTANGKLPFLDPGTYYFWRHHKDYIFTDPDTEIVS